MPSRQLSETGVISRMKPAGATISTRDMLSALELALEVPRFS
jgi:hypothetical protein